MQKNPFTLKKAPRLGALIFCFLTTSCSVYKSSDRKDFENLSVTAGGTGIQNETELCPYGSITIKDGQGVEYCAEIPQALRQ